MADINRNDDCDNTPHVTVNQDVTADLDPSIGFEGSEKLLEVWFAPSTKSLPSSAKEGGLKAVSLATWETMLRLVNCQVLSIVESDHVDAYLLSESSMFVWAHKMILKTCGTTTLLLGLRRLLRIAATDAGFPFHNALSLEDDQAAATPYRVFYSRKNFLFPDKQRGPHRSWKEEATFMDNMFEAGSAYLVGKMNSDHWYLYMTSPNSVLTSPQTLDGARTRSAKIHTKLTATGDEVVQDETLEILMTDLDVELARQFHFSHANALAADWKAQHQRARNEAHGSLGTISDSHLTSTLTNPNRTTEGHALGTVVSDQSGLSDVYPTSIFPDTRIDAYLFAPCGFSANGIIPAPHSNESGTHHPAEHYFTVHVTPEPNCSYASFETNMPGGRKGRPTADVIGQVIRIFRPGRFSLTQFEAKTKNGDESCRRASKQWNEYVAGYRRIHRIVYDFEDYELFFRYYERDKWVNDDRRVW